MKLTRRSYIAGTVATLVGGLAAPALAQITSRNFTLNLGPDGYWYLLHHITQGAGFFKTEGVDVDVFTVNSGARQMAAVLGGSADAAIVNITGTVQAIQNGGDVASIATMYNTFAHVVLLSNEAMTRSGITLQMPIDEKARRLKGLRIGITGPSSGSDQLIRTILRARGMDPDQEVKLQPLGTAEAMLAALEQKAIDGFVMSAPTPQIAIARGLGNIVFNTVAGEVPEFNGLTYLGLTSSPKTISAKSEMLAAVVRAYTRGMKFNKENPEETRRICRAHFTELDDATFNATYAQHIRGVPTTPILSPSQFKQSLQSINFGAAKPIDAPYERAFYPEFAKAAARDILAS